MNTHEHWVTRTIGALETTGQELHRRIDDEKQERRRQILDVRRDLMCHISKKPNRGGKPLWMHLAPMVVMGLLGLVGLMKPETVREALGHTLVHMITR